MISGNTVSVTTLIEEIQSELNDQTGSWRKVSELLNQADVEFGFGTDKMKQILGQTDISPSKASKLISIAQDDRIRQNSSVFETVSAWTTLYQATLLNDEEFSELVNIVSAEGVLKVSDIRNVQDKKAKSSKSNYQSLLNVQFDWNAIKAQAVSSEDVQKVIDKLNEFASEITYMKVETVPRYEKEIDKFNEEVIKEFNKQSKKFYKSKEAAHKKPYKIKEGKPIEALDPESITIYLYENNFIELFDNLGILGEYQLKYTNLLSVASDVVAKRRAKKYGDKIAAPDEDDTASYRDWEFKEIKSMSNWKGTKRLKKVEIKI
ncbi:hypothetical protein N9381_04505 [Paracoccaceae bacterium]|nr:hypothetical protein [Paracoccaceae bacterium]